MSNIPLIINGEVVHRGASRRQQTLGEDIRRKVLRGAGDEDDKRTLGQIASDLFLPYCTAKSAAFLGTWYACMYGMGELWPIGFMLGVIVAIFLGTRGADEGRQGELSAYSVYNPDGERLAGELTAESLDRQIRGGGTDTDVRASQLRAGMEGAASSGGGQRLGAAAGGSDAEHRSEAELEAEEERLLQAAIDASMQDEEDNTINGETGTTQPGARSYQRRARQKYLHSKKHRGRG